MLIEVTSAQHLQRVLGDNNKALLCFLNRGCGPCRSAHPKLQRIAESYSQTNVILVWENIKGHGFDIRATPTIIFYLNGRQTKKIEGYQENEIISFVSQNHSEVRQSNVIRNDREYSSPFSSDFRRRSQKNQGYF